MVLLRNTMLITRPRVMRVRSMSMCIPTVGVLPG
jgi:hypothetical protein